MLNQELASIMHFIIVKAGNPTPYYWEVPEGFFVPAVYFPAPEINSRGDTLSSYVLEYVCFIKFFHKDTQSAEEIAYSALVGLQSSRNIVPLIGPNGAKTSKSMRIKHPSLRKIEVGAFQLEISWDSQRPYNTEDIPKMMNFDIDVYTEKAYRKAIKQMEKEA